VAKLKITLKKGINKTLKDQVATIQALGLRKNREYSRTKR